MKIIRVHPLHFLQRAEQDNGRVMRVEKNTQRNARRINNYRKQTQEDGRTTQNKTLVESGDLNTRIHAKQVLSS